MAEDKMSAVEERERVTQAWLVATKAEQSLGSNDLSFYDLPLGWQHQVTRENPVLFPLDGEAMKQTLNTDSPFELLEDRQRVGSKLWLWEKLEKLATLAIEGMMDGNAYAEECEKLRAQAREKYKQAEFVAPDLDSKSLEDFKGWKEAHTHLWDKILDQYYDDRQSLIEKRGYEDLDATEAIADYQLGLQPKEEIAYVRWMVGFDWILDLGPKAQWLESLRAMRRSKG